MELTLENILTNSYRIITIYSPAEGGTRYAIENCDTGDKNRFWVRKDGTFEIML